jgi:hypothetical protein
MCSRTFRSKYDVNQKNASVTIRQAGQSKEMVEAHLSCEERKTILKWYFFPFLKCVRIFGTLCIYSLLRILLLCAVVTS